ncbi:hypothetical protein [Pantoea sp. B_9]|uniref:hypothetical protein n=1 Tax=Pantoea sp. B_9 TaxID=2608009 RepID=UPI001CC1E0F9|nr:hypothetical protein [Pantoea sp. B_9]
MHDVTVCPDAVVTSTGTRWYYQGPLWTLGSMATEAAIRGEGVALGRSVLIADDVAAGRLVVPFPQYKLKAERGYDLVYRPHNRDSFKLQILKQWLFAEIGLKKD